METEGFFNIFVEVSQINSNFEKKMGFRKMPEKLENIKPYLIVVYIIFEHFNQFVSGKTFEFSC